MDADRALTALLGTFDPSPGPLHPTQAAGVAIALLGVAPLAVFLLVAFGPLRSAGLLVILPLAGLHVAGAWLLARSRPDAVPIHALLGVLVAAGLLVGLVFLRNGGGIGTSTTPILTWDAIPALQGLWTLLAALFPLAYLAGLAALVWPWAGRYARLVLAAAALEGLHATALLLALGPPESRAATALFFTGWVALTCASAMILLRGRVDLGVGDAGVGV